MFFFANSLEKATQRFRTKSAILNQSLSFRIPGDKTGRTLEEKFAK